MLLAVDFGRQKSGVAVGNLITGGARPLMVARGDRDKQLDIIAKCVDEWKPGQILVGAPRRMDGKKHAMTESSRRFGDHLMRRFNLPVRFVDERLTTVAARRYGGAEIDAIAAAILLQAWLDDSNVVARH